MIYQSQKMGLKTVRIVKKGDVNDILICKDTGTADGSLYTLIVVKEHTTAKKYLEIFEESDSAAKESYIDSFSQDGNFCMVFPYKNERPVDSFYMGNSYTLAECEDVCINLILACITAAVPYPILYLMLEQNQIHLAKDHSVYFGYQIDLTGLDRTISEKECVVQCARILLELLAPKANQKAVSYILLRKKIAKKSYQKFTELYKDVRIAAVSKKKKGIRAKLKTWYLRNRDRLFRILLGICTVLAVVVVVSFVSQILFGDVPWLRFFINSFKEIGTENLTGK